jgi:hypothetical protein
MKGSRCLTEIMHKTLGDAKKATPMDATRIENGLQPLFSRNFPICARMWIGILQLSLLGATHSLQIRKSRSGQCKLT